jgi:hypothetical protein
MNLLQITAKRRRTNQLDSIMDLAERAMHADIGPINKGEEVEQSQKRNKSHIDLEESLGQHNI